MADWYFRNANAQSGLKACPGCRNLVRAGEEFCPYCARRLKPEAGLRAAFRRFLNLPAIATRALIAVIAVVFVLQIVADLLLPPQYRVSSGGLGFMLVADPVTYIRMGSNFHLFIEEYDQYWRLIDSCFLHFGLIHILFNCWAFWDLGRLAEKLWGARQVFATFIITGAIGALASYVVNIHILSHPMNSAGASGAICGILGLLLGAYYKNRYQIGEFLGSQLIRWAVYILVFGLVAGADNSAHVGGMLSGAALGYFLPPTARSRSLARDEKIWAAASYVSLLAMLASFALAIYFFAQGPALVRALLN